MIADFVVVSLVSLVSVVSPSLLSLRLPENSLLHSPLASEHQVSKQQHITAPHNPIN